MQHNEQNDCDIEDIIELLYKIADALHICEENSAIGLESAFCLREILSVAQLKAATLLGRASERHSYSRDDETVYGRKQNKRLVPN